MWKIATGGGKTTRITRFASRIFDLYWSAAGDALFVVSDLGGAHYNVWQVPLADPERARRLTWSQADCDRPSVSNDGRWLVYTDNRMGALEWLALGAGSIVLFITLWRWAQSRWTDEGRSTAAIIGWSLALTLPYFVTWFWSYSYHYRLSFAIVPLMIVLFAALADRLLQAWTGCARPRLRAGTCRTGRF